MNIGFVVLRNTLLKTYGCLIEACLGKGHNVFAFYQPQAAHAGKAYQAVSRETFSPFQDDRFVPIEHYPEESTLSGLCEKYQINVLVAHEGYHVFKTYGLYEDIPRIKEAGIKLVSICHFYETAQRPLEVLDIFDKTYYISPFGRDLHFKLQVDSGRQEAVREEYASRFEVAGSAMFDQIGRCTNEQARKQYNLPPGKKVVLFMAPVTTRGTPWRFYMWRNPNKVARTKLAIKKNNWNYLYEIWTGPSFKQVVEAIREFCDRNEAVLVIKSRGKQDDPEYLQDAADIYIDGFEDEYYPVFTTYQLLAAADLCITAASMTVVEAVIAGVPVVNIVLPHLDFDPPPTPLYARYIEAIMSNRCVTPLNYPGCVQAVDRRKIVKWLKGKKLEDITMDAEARRAYLEEYTGVGARSSSERILESIEELVGDGS